MKMYDFEVWVDAGNAGQFLVGRYESYDEAMDVLDTERNSYEEYAIEHVFSIWREGECLHEI